MKWSGKDHLNWLFDRMINVHGENENYDYMRRFREIIESMEDN